MEKKKKKGKAGRPKVEIDWDQAEKMANIHCTGEEIASILGIDYDTLESNIRRRGYSDFSEWYKKHSNFGKRSLRRKQFEQALNGNVPLLIWLGKQFLDQHDNMFTKTENTTVQKSVVVFETEWGNQSESKAHESE